ATVATRVMRSDSSTMMSTETRATICPKGSRSAAWRIRRRRGAPSVGLSRSGERGDAPECAALGRRRVAVSCADKHSPLAREVAYRHEPALHAHLRSGVHLLSDPVRAAHDRRSALAARLEVALAVHPERP